MIKVDHWYSDNSSKKLYLVENVNAWGEVLIREMGTKFYRSLKEESFLELFTYYSP